MKQERESESEKIQRNGSQVFMMKMAKTEPKNYESQMFGMQMVFKGNFQK